MNQKQNDFDSLVRRLANESDGTFHQTSWEKMEVLLDQRKKRRALWWIWPITMTLTLIGVFFIAYLNRPTKLTPGTSFNNSVALNTNAPYKGASSTELSFTARNIFVMNGRADFLNPTTNYGTENSHTTNTLATASVPTPDPIKDANTNSQKELISTSNKSASNQSIHSDKTQNKTVPNKNIADQIEKNNNSIIRKNKRSNFRTNKAFLAETTSPKSTKNDPEYTKFLESNSPSNNAIKTDELNTDKSSENGASLFEINKHVRYSVHTLPITYGALYELNRSIQQKTRVPDIAATNNSKPLKNKNYFTLSATYAPEWTHVPSRNYGKRSNALGFGIGYSIGKHITLNTGVQQTNKLYHATGTDYSVTPGTYWEGKSIFDINAVCKVTEWPILLGYQMNLKNNNKLVIHIGTASLKMNSEKYDYTYAYYPAGPRRMRNLLVENKNWEWFAAGVLSVNYMKPITKNLAVSVSPYFKTPFKGVGIGKIDLQSVGGQIGLHYNIRSPF